MGEFVEIAALEEALVDSINTLVHLALGPGMTAAVWVGDKTLAPGIFWKALGEPGDAVGQVPPPQRRICRPPGTGAYRRRRPQAASKPTIITPGGTANGRVRTVGITGRQFDSPPSIIHTINQGPKRRCPPVRLTAGVFRS